MPAWALFGKPLVGAESRAVLHDLVRSGGDAAPVVHGAAAAVGCVSVRKAYYTCPKDAKVQEPGPNCKSSILSVLHPAQRYMPCTAGKTSSNNGMA